MKLKKIMIDTSSVAMKEIAEALESGAKVYCYFKKGEKYQVRSVHGHGLCCTVILAQIGPVNCSSRRIEGWEIVRLEDIHNNQNGVSDSQRSSTDSKYFEILKKISLCGSEWSDNDNFNLIKIPSYLWKELTELVDDH